MTGCGHSQTSRISPDAACDSSLFEEPPERVLDSDAPSRSVAFLEAPSVLPDLGRLNKDSFIDPLRLINSLCNVVLSSHTGLTSFIRSALGPVVTCKVQLDASSSSLWPVPPPRFCWTASARLGPKRRRRKRFYEMKHRLVQLIISALNWAELGHPSVAPERASVGAVISPSQHAVIERVESLVTHFLHVGHFTRDDLGRSFEKFQDLIRCCEELPFVSSDLGFEDLDSFLSFLHSDLDPYGSHFSRKPTCSTHGSSTAQDDRSVLGKMDSKLASSTGSKPVVADRVKWNNPPSFHAEHYLDNELCRCAFLDPEVLRKPVETWPRAQPARVHCSQDELFRLARRWDELGACKLFRTSDVNWDECVGLFCVPKDSDFDRLIVNPVTVNSRMHSLSDATRTLAPGAMLCLLSLETDQVFRFSADDLTDYYYTFVVSDSRAKRNTIRMKFQGEQFKGFRCYRPELAGHEVQIALATLAMGDNLAVEIAQSAHRSVLQQLVGSMLPGEVMQYRHPCPRTDFVELLAIDDHIGLQKLPRSDFVKAPRLRDTEVFEAASKAYARVGLIQQPKKQKRDLLEGTLLGADFNGDVGRVCAPRSRVSILMLISVCIAQRGTCTPAILMKLMGCWVSVLMFRRALFAVVNTLFQESQGLSPHDIFKLSSRARNELLMLAILAPTAQSDLRATYCPKIFCMDASPTGGAVCSAEIGSEACRELWRHTEQRGYYTKLLSPASSLLAEKGITPLTSEGLAPEPLIVHQAEPFIPTIPQSLDEGYLFDVIELFRGVGNWTQIHLDRGLVAHDGIDIDGRRLRCGDLASRSTCRELVALALRKVVREWHAGLPCVSFGTLRRPQVRSLACPFGFDPTEPFTAYHNMLAQRTAFILTIAVMLGQFISVEQPLNSRLFRLHCFKTLIGLGCIISKFASCAFGSAFQKPQKWLHNKPWLVNLECKCNCPLKGKHFVAQGSFTADAIDQFDKLCRPSAVAVYGRLPQVGETVAHFSAAYPVQLMHQMASGSLAAKQGRVGKIPLRCRIETLKEVGLDESVVPFDATPETPFPARPWHEDPEWINDLCESLPFREVFRFKFRQPGHINVNETRTYKSWIKSLSKSHPNSRVVGLLDSRVTLGAAAKGRSSSYSISRVLGGSIAYIIGSGIYPGGLHCYSAANRADGPSRNRPVPPPSKEIPGWFEALCRGDPRHFDAVVAASRIQKLPGRWLRLLLLLGGDIERNPGPSKLLGRGKLDMSVGFRAETAVRMSKCLQAFSAWISSGAQLPWEKVCSDPEALSWALRAYGMHCFEIGLPRYMYTYAITACQDRFPACKPHLGPAWQVDRKWQVHEPGQCRSILPAIAIRACACLACLWRWFSWMGCMLLGFAAMLHPAEIVALRRKDLIFPSDVAFDCSSLFIHIRDPQTARFARRQHGRIDDCEIISISEALFWHLALNQKLFVGSLASFRKQWDCVLGRLGIPHKQLQRGATPGSLRGSGATYLYTHSEDVNWVAWRGRWSRVRTLEYYLQEVSAQLLVHELQPAAKARVLALSEVSFTVIAASLNLRCRN